MNTLWFGGLLAVVASAWGYVRTVWSQITSLVFIECSVEYAAAEALLIYVADHFRRIPLGPRVYYGTYLHVRSAGRSQVVAWELLGRMGTIYLRGLRPLLITRPPPKQNSEPTSDVMPSAITLTVLRGVIDPDRLIGEAVTYYNRVRLSAGVDHQRHFVRRMFGMSRKRARMGQTEEAKATLKTPGGGEAFGYRSARPLIHSRDDLGQPGAAINLASLALPPSAEKAVTQARRWKASEAWYKAHGLLWRYSMLFYGGAGNGKTSLARALAEDLDLPLFIYDLTTFDNSEFIAAWMQMLGDAPCQALFEDFGDVFDGRKNVSGGEMTFDCLLNCLNGVERADGLLVVITTNHVERIDPALGAPRAPSPLAEEGDSTRPGRVDRIVDMRAPDRAGREKIARRILDDHPETWAGVLAEGQEDTGAQFEFRCASLALRLFWEGDESPGRLTKAGDPGDEPGKIRDPQAKGDPIP